VLIKQNLSNSMARRITSSLTVQPKSVGLFRGPLRVASVHQRTTCYFDTTASQVKNQTMLQKSHRLAKEHGPLFMVWGTLVWAVTGVASYMAIENGTLDVFEVIKWIDVRMVTSLVESLDTGTGNVARACVANQAMAPLRLTFTVATAPYIIRWLSKR